VWVPTVFSKNRDRLLGGDIAQVFFQAVRGLAEQQQLLSPEHFTVDGTLLEAWASHKSFQPIDRPPPPSDDDPGNPSVNFRGEKRSNTTHRSVTDPDTRLVRKTHHGAAFLGYQASVVTENRHGLIVETDVRSPSGYAEREAALVMLRRLGRRQRRRTVGADKGYDTDEFVAAVRALGFTPHIAPNRHRYRSRSPIDARTTRHPGYEWSQRRRKLVEEGFGWHKCIGLLRKLHHRGRALVSWIFTFTSAAYNLIRIRRLLFEAPT
jgi:hypothetical protein